MALHEIMYTTDHERNIQSVLEVSDLTELMDMATLAEREFLGERQHVVVLNNTVKDPLAQQRDAAARREAEARNAHRLRLPRRPAWTSSMSADELDHRERTAFVAWRRELAAVEEEELLVLTPFEKNLEMWRQLWRVLERSDLVVQVVDARDPLFYWSPDMAAYAREIHASKGSMLLLNKADLLSQAQRKAWADHFDALGLPYAFWSAKAETDAAAAAKAGLPPPPLAGAAAATAAAAAAAGGANGSSQASKGELGPGAAASRGEEDMDDPRCRLYGVDDLLDLLEERAREVAAKRGGSGGADGSGSETSSNPRVIVGLTGYPNVGKSSTINALYGAKKAAVAPTPGKTKHFQTLNVTPGLVLCDCPGLVLPRFAANKAEMVAAGVLPIDRLTDVRGPVEVVASRIPVHQLEATYGIKLGPGQPKAGPLGPSEGAGGGGGQPPHAIGGSSRHVSAVELLRALSLGRGCVVANGLPDEARAGRVLLRDYCSGKLVFAYWPPEAYQALAAAPGRAAGDRADAGGSATTSAAARMAGEGRADGGEDDDVSQGSAALPHRSGAAAVMGGTASASAAAAAGDSGGSSSQEGTRAGPGGGDAGGSAASNGQPAATALSAAQLELTEADLELLDELNSAGKGDKSKRPDYKFQKKAARTKGNRGRNDGDELEIDGSALRTGKKGGIVRVTGYL